MKKDLIIPSEQQKKYTGEYIGTVISVEDPEHLMRVKVRVHPLFDGVPDSDLPWAEYRLPIGCRAGEGHFIPARVDDTVWVDFPHDGSSRRPRITGSVHYCPSGTPNLPPGSWAGDAYVPERTSDEPMPAAIGYHDGAIVVEENGCLLEMAADASVRVTQKSSGTAIEIAANGMVTIHSAGNVNISSDGRIKAYALGTVVLDGSQGDDTKGIVQGHCICAYTGKPHKMISRSVKGSLY